MPDFAADLVAVHAGQHQVEQNQVRLEGVKLPDSLFSIVYNFCVIAFLGQIERNQFCDIVIVIDDQNFLFGSHKRFSFTGDRTEPHTVCVPSHIFLSFYFLNVTIVTPASPSPNSAKWKSATCFWRRR